MIGRLKGEVVALEDDGSILVDVAGVGYEVFIPLGVQSPIGEAITLYIHTHVREDALTLYGFSTQDDRAAFRALLGVSNVGPKLARAILGALDANALARAIALEDRGALKGISGVGKKTVERIFIDLQGKLVPRVPSALSPRAPAAPSGPGESAIAALVQMGYKRPEAQRAVESVMQESEAIEDVAAILRRALGALS